MSDHDGVEQVITMAWRAHYARHLRPVAVSASFWHRGRRWPIRRRILVKLP
jgi:hypothetical protein